MNINLSSEKAEIIGLLCAEGSHYAYTTTWDCFFKNRGPNGKYYRLTRTIEAVEFTNLNQGLLEHFRRLMNTVYSYAPRQTGIKTSIKIRIKKKDVINDLLHYTDFGCTKWGIPEEIFDSSIQIKTAFIRGLFDGDGSMQKSRIRLSLVNSKGVADLKKLLHSIGIDSEISGPLKVRGNRKPQYILTIKGEGVLIYKKLVSSIMIES